MSKTIYIAGPMRGYERYNFDAFMDAEVVLAEMGLSVLNPARNDLDAGFDPETPESDITPDMMREFMAWDVNAVMRSDAIALLPGWENSEGANVEKRLAEWCGIEVMYYVNGEIEFTDPNETQNATDSIKEITDERGSNYGHPFDHFQCTQKLFNVWTNRNSMPLENDELERCLRHIVYMICDKLARLAENPLHMDNFDDIQGYASLWKMCVDKADPKYAESVTQKG